MSSKPSPGIKKSMDSLYNVFYGLRNLSQGHERPLRNAMYNILVIVGVGAIIAVGIVLGPFLKPLIWAFLFGAVLHPFKRKLSFGLKSWFEGLEATDTSVAVGAMIAPFKLLENCGEYCTNWFREHIKLIAGGFFGIILIRILMACKSNGIFCMLWRSIFWAHSFFTNMLSNLNWIIVSSF